MMPNPTNTNMNKIPDNAQSLILRRVCKEGLSGPLRGCGNRRLASHAGAAQREDVADDFGDRPVVLGRDVLIDLDALEELARQRLVLDDRYAMLGRHLANAL